MHEPIRQEILLPARPEQIWAALTDAASFSRMSGGAPTSIDTAAGGAFSCFGGMIHGQQIEVVPHRRLVQAWRVKAWPEGTYSIARFDLAPEGDGTRLVLEHSGFPAAQREHLDAGWHTNYWKPLAASL